MWRETSTTSPSVRDWPLVPVPPPRGAIRIPAKRGSASRRPMRARSVGAAREGDGLRHQAIDRVVGGEHRPVGIRGREVALEAGGAQRVQEGGGGRLRRLGQRQARDHDAARPAQAAARRSPPGTTIAPGSAGRRPSRTATMLSAAPVDMPTAPRGVLAARCGVGSTRGWLAERAGQVQRLLLEDIDAGPGQVAAIERGQQRRLVDDAAAGGMDQDGAARQQGELGRADQAAGRGVQRAMQRQHLGTRQQGAEIGDPLARPGQRPGGQQRVIGR